MAPGKWPEEGVTQYRPVRQEPHSPVHQTATTPLKPATPPPATEVPPLGAAEILLLGLLGCDAGMAAACSGKDSQQQQAPLAPDTSPRSPPAAQVRDGVRMSQAIRCRVVKLFSAVRCACVCACARAVLGQRYPSISHAVPTCPSGPRRRWRMLLAQRPGRRHRRIRYSLHQPREQETPRTR